MATQTCTVEMNTQHLNLSTFESNSFSTDIEPNLDTIPNHPIFSDSSKNLESVFGYDFINFDQATTSMPWLHEGGFQTSDIDPGLVLSQTGAFSGTIPSTYSPTSLSAKQFGFFTDASSGRAEAFLQNPASDSPISETQNPNGVKKRRTRKKKAPLPPAVKEEKRRAFLERNRQAARKCREKNRQRWDRIQGRCLDLEAQNTVLKERGHELKADVERLSKLVREHRECGDKEMRELVGRYEVDEVSGELGRENDVVVPALGSPSMSQGESTSSFLEAKNDEEHDIAATVESGISPDANKSIISSLPSDLEFDMSSFIADENDVPSLSSSRKTSATSTEFKLDLIPPKNVPSPANSTADPIADIITHGKLDEMKQGENVAVLGQE